MQESNARLARKFALWTGAAVVSLIVIGVGWGAIKLAAFFSFMRKAEEPIHAKHKYLEEPKVAEVVALKLASFCQSLNEGKELTSSELSMIIPELSGTNEISYGSATTNSAHLEMGGGFWHFGYKLNLDDRTSASTTNVWVLTLYSEGRADKELVRLPLAAGARFDTNKVNGQQSQPSH